MHFEIEYPIYANTQREKKLQRNIYKMEKRRKTSNSTARGLPAVKMTVRLNHFDIYSTVYMVNFDTNT